MHCSYKLQKNLKHEVVRYIDRKDNLTNELKVAGKVLLPVLSPSSVL